jgi:hypothetical protein
MDDISYTDLLHVETFMGFKIEVWKWQHPVLNHLCAYVFLPEDHIFHGQHYDHITSGKKNGITLMYELTHSGLDDNGYWCIGFDTAQSCTQEQCDNKTSLENTINELKALVRWL